MKKIVGTIAVAALMIAGALGITAVEAGQGQGQGHTPVGVCHWVPAHGGSFVFIVVDDDGANGNKNLRGHDRDNHENNIVPAVEGQCFGPE